MGKLTSHLFISLDGVVEAPDRFLRDELYQDLSLFEDETIAGQDAVPLGRKTYEEWSMFWPDSKIEPFATFINNVPKYVASKSLKTLGWSPSNLLSGDVLDEIATLKTKSGKAIGVHGSVGLVQALLVAGLLDESRLTLCPAVAGQGRRLLSREGEPTQLALQSARTTPRGLQYLVFRPRTQPALVIQTVHPRTDFRKPACRTAAAERHSVHGFLHNRPPTPPTARRSATGRHHLSLAAPPAVRSFCR